MANRHSGAVLRHIHTLFSVGAVGGLTDRHLLERFRTHGGDSAEAAFATLVERHGPMVLGVCRAILRDEHDAQDAFQATFLVLVRKAGSIRNRDSVGSWLCGVAQRVASCARSAEARRRKHERRRSAMEGRFVGDCDHYDLGSVLHEEINRLPESYRAPIVLCHLEGLTHEEAAHHLRWPVGTVKSRMARGRERLRSRLIRRGVAPSGGLLGEALCAEQARASVSAALAEATVGAAMRLGAGNTAAIGAVSAPVAFLTEEVLKAMILTKLKVVAAVLALGAFAAGAGVIAQQEPVPEPVSAASRPESEPRLPEDAPAISPAPSDVEPSVSEPIPPSEEPQPTPRTNRRRSTPPPASPRPQPTELPVPTRAPFPPSPALAPQQVPPSRPPSAPKANPTRSLDQIRDRALREATEALAQLDARAAEQRAELRRTEADLERAKELIQALGSKERLPLRLAPGADGRGAFEIPPPDNEVSIPPPDTDPFGRPVLATPSSPLDPFEGADVGEGPVIPAANVSDQERRLREMERKLDLILKMLDGPRHGESPQLAPVPSGETP